jgi:phosphoglycerate kinase
VKFLTIDDFDVENKTVFLRVDINSPIDPTTNEILNDTRIKAVKPTLDSLKNAKVVLGSHQSRPGKGDFTSLEEHAKILQRYCSQRVTFIDDVFGPCARQAIRELKSGEVLVLDNLRFCSEENIEDSAEKLAKTHLVRKLAVLFDIFINDAFAVSHRSQPSLVGFAEVLPAAAGKLMEKELKSLDTLLEEPARPCVYVLGGAKVEEKVPVIENILKNGKSDKILLGGVLAKIFLKATGLDLGKKHEEELRNLEMYVKKAKELLARYSESIELPVDLAVSKDDKRVEIQVKDLPVNEISLDIGKETIKKYMGFIKDAKTVVANGPLGVFEKDSFDLGTRRILEGIAESGGFTVIGGGHLTGLAGMLGIEDKFSHVCTAGGAMLSYLAGEKLPAIEALIRAAERFRKAGRKFT